VSKFILFVVCLIGGVFVTGFSELSAGMSVSPINTISIQLGIALVPFVVGWLIAKFVLFFNKRIPFNIVWFICSIATMVVMFIGSSSNDDKDAKSADNDLILRIKYCELLYDDGSNKFIYNFHPSIKSSDQYNYVSVIRSGKEDDVNSLLSMLRKADAEGRVDEARILAAMIKENLISIFYNKTFSEEFINKQYFSSNSIDVCIQQRRNALIDYANSTYINEISGEQRLDIFRKYVAIDTAYINANEATKNAIRLRYKVE
jgi:hypothetical protein